MTLLTSLNNILVKITNQPAKTIIQLLQKNKTIISNTQL